ncbi:MAG TPA: gamma-glutamyl-gamma-aminobutyrate hydrolase family protein [Bacteroidia bacterium]|jgi:GMP synthase (glutamine-hydrolysing)|nr:gamma-glutamyl-gamma-aminobutyrate hydrolase family protein [Bacteroidia bacterium]
MFHIIDFGSRKVPLIAEMLHSLGNETRIHKWNDIDYLSLRKSQGIVLSGSPAYLTEIDHEPYETHCGFLRDTSLPVLGICFGHQILGILHGAEIYRGPEIRGSNSLQLLAKDPLFENFDSTMEVKEDHTEGISLPKGFIHLASSASYPNEAMKHPEKKMWGIQFHPEVSGETGRLILGNFCKLAKA